MERFAEDRRGLEQGEGLGIETGQLPEDRRHGLGAGPAVRTEDLQILRIAHGVAADLVRARMVSEQLRGLLGGERPEAPHLQQAIGSRPRGHFRCHGGELALPVCHEAQHVTAGGRLEQLLDVRQLVGREEVDVIHHGEQGAALGRTRDHLTEVLRGRGVVLQGRGGGSSPGRADRYPSGSRLGRDRPHESTLADARVPDQRHGPPRPVLDSDQG